MRATKENLQKIGFRTFGPEKDWQYTLGDGVTFGMYSQKTVKGVIERYNKVKYNKGFTDACNIILDKFNKIFEKIENKNLSIREISVRLGNAIITESEKKRDF